MEIVRAEIFKIEIPGVYVSQRFGPWSPVILRLETGEGVTGLGEIPFVYGIANSAGVGMLQGLINKFVIGADPLQVEKLWNEMYHNAVWSRGGGPVVFGGLSAIDEALLDIKGKVLDVPVFDLFGGRQRDRGCFWYKGTELS